MNPAEVLGDFRVLDSERRSFITTLETAQKRRNELSPKIGALKQAEKKGNPDSDQQQELAELSEAVSREKVVIEDYEQRVTQADDKFKAILKGVPNLPHESVPVGKSAEDNVEVRRWGTAPKFDFTPKPHWELGEQLGVLDLERAAKMTGARFAVYWDMGAKLERALINFMLDLHTREHGYTEVLPPFLVNSESMYGTGQLPKFAADLFKRAAWRKGSLADSDRRGSGHESVSRRDARRSAAADLADRLHAVFSQRSRVVRQGRARHHPPAPVSESGTGEVRPAGTFLRGAGEADPRRRRQSCRSWACTTAWWRCALATWDFRSAKTYDIEVWLPGQNAVPRDFFVFELRVVPGAAREHPFPPRGQGKTEFVHTLNGSGLAVGRTWVAIVENYQQADGSVLVPEALRPYVGADRITPKKF